MTVLYYFVYPFRNDAPRSIAYIYVGKFPLQKNRLKILRRSAVYYGRVNIMASDVRNLLSTVKERRNVDEIGSGEGDGWEAEKVSCPKQRYMTGLSARKSIQRFSLARTARKARRSNWCCAKLAHGRDTTGTIDKKLISGVSIGR